MPCQLVLAEQDQQYSVAHEARSRLLFEKSARLISGNDQEFNAGLVDVVYEIQKHPDNLAAHVYRILICYRVNLTEALYAALIDLLIVLNRRGQALSRRMVGGALTKLNRNHVEALKHVFGNCNSDPALLEGNCFSLFSRGLTGTGFLIEKHVAEEVSERNSLRLAQDAVEYSQLDEAMQILENSLDEQDQQDGIHQLLLELYRSTANHARFSLTLSSLNDLDWFAENSSLKNRWQLLQDYFEQKQREHHAR